LSVEQAGGGTGEQVFKSGSRRPAIPGLGWCGARGRGSHPRTRAASGLRSEVLRPPARSWLMAEWKISAESAARRRKENAAVERREAHRPAIRPSSPAIRRWTWPRGRSPGAAIRTSACRRSAPPFF